MKKVILFLIILSTFSTPTYGAIEVYGNKIIDSSTNTPIGNAKITIPKYNYSTYTDADGNFNLARNVDGSTIMSVEKDGYRPFSLTINNNPVLKSISIGINACEYTTAAITLSSNY